ncbi:hypothetical protein M0805_009650, partial [Coniferiporia weirii]
MPRAKALMGPSRLSQILKHLNQPPQPALFALKSLNLTLAARGDHSGVRHFLKEDLPRIQFANPDLEIQVSKLPRTAEDKRKTELLLEYKNGSTKSLNISSKWSTAIFEEVMDVAGGDRWRQFKAERRAAGKEPVIPELKTKPAPVRPPPPPPK